MDDKQATDKYWGIINSGGAGLKNMPPEELQALIARLESVEGEGSKYAATLREMSSSNKMGDLSSQLTDFQSPLYQQYASYLQKTTPGIGVNSMLAPLMAGGTGYAGGQAIANQKVSALSKKRSDMTGNKNPNWEEEKGDFIHDGYRVLYRPDHKHSDKKGCILEHRFVWIEAHGEIPKGYMILHKDFNKLNNELINLQLTTKREHAILHRGTKKRKTF